MALKIGIVGLPNTGKTTLFNALVGAHQAKVENYPFTTIEPNVGMVEVPDERLQKIAQTMNHDVSQPAGRNHHESQGTKIVPAVIEFIDIAGLLKNAHKGEGLGNEFLSHIRSVDAILLLLRHFEDKNVPHSQPKIDPYDLSLIHI